MKIINKKSITDDLSKYTYSTNKSDYIEITEWENGEGFNIDLNGTLISLSHGDLAAINLLTNYLIYQSKDE